MEYVRQDHHPEFFQHISRYILFWDDLPGHAAGITEFHCTHNRCTVNTSLFYPSDSVGNQYKMIVNAGGNIALENSDVSDYFPVREIFLKLLHLLVSCSNMLCLFMLQSSVWMLRTRIHKYPASLCGNLCSSQFVDIFVSVIINLWNIPWPKLRILPNSSISCIGSGQPIPCKGFSKLVVQFIANIFAVQSCKVYSYLNIRHMLLHNGTDIIQHRGCTAV